MSARIDSLAIVVAAVCLAVFGVGKAALAGVGDHAWSKGWPIGGVQVAVDGASRLLAGGTTNTAVDFGGGLLTPTGPSVFLASFEPDGSHRWSRLIAPTSGMGAFLTAVAAAPSGDVYIACQLQNGSIDLGGGPLSGNANILLAKYDVDGNHQWSFACGPGTVYDLDATDSRVAVAARNLSATVDFGGGAIGAVGNIDAIFAVLTAAGGHVWSAGFGDASGQEGRDVGLLPSGEVVVLATVRGTTDFGGGALVADVDNDLALARFDAAGAHVWSAIHHGALGGTTDLGMDVTPAGEIAITGQFSGSIDFGGGSLSATAIDIFVARLSAIGGHVWSARYGGAGDDRGMMVTIDSDGNLGLSGRIGAAVDFGGGPLPYVALTDAFVASFDATGAHRFSHAYGTASSESRAEHVVDAQGATIFHGNGGAPIDLGGGPLAVGSTFAFWIGKFEGSGAATAVVSPGLAQPGRAGFHLSAAPNPFEGTTVIQLTASADARQSVAAAWSVADDPMELAVFDVRGRRVRTWMDLAAGDRSAGSGAVSWDGRDDAGGRVPAGVYFVRAEAYGMTQAARLVELR